MHVLESASAAFPDSSKFQAMIKSAASTASRKTKILESSRARGRRLGMRAAGTAGLPRIPGFGLPEGTLAADLVTAPKSLHLAMVSTPSNPFLDPAVWKSILANGKSLSLHPRGGLMKLQCCFCVCFFPNILIIFSSRDPVSCEGSIA